MEPSLNSPLYYVQKWTYSQSFMDKRGQQAFSNQIGCQPSRKVVKQMQKNRGEKT